MKGIRYDHESLQGSGGNVKTPFGEVSLCYNEKNMCYNALKFYGKFWPNLEIINGNKH